MRRPARQAAFAAVLSILACARGREPVSSRTSQPTNETVLTFTATVDVETGTVTFAADPVAAGALTQIPIVQDGVAGSGPADTVELVTTAAVQVADGCGAGVWSLDATVDLRSFFAGARLANAHVEILSMTPTGREACNSAPAIEGHTAEHGLFAYGDVEPSGVATATWRFRLPTTAPFTFRGRVVADVVQPAAPGPHGAPTCADLGPSCDTGSLVVGRGFSWYTEWHPPSTIWDSCGDGEWGDPEIDESLDRLRIRTLDGSVLAPGKLVRVEAVVRATDPAVVLELDALDLFVHADPLGPSGPWDGWVPIATLLPSAPGVQTLTAETALPWGGGLQAIRGVFRRGGAVWFCPGGPYDDADDLLFAVDPNAGIDNEPPTVTLSVAGGGPVSGTVPIWIEGSDNSGSATASLYVDGALVGIADTFPGTVDWNTTALADGPHVLTAVAHDPSGNEATSPPVTVTTDNTPPVIALTSPIDGAELGPSFTATATVDDPGVWVVQFQLDGLLLASDYTPPWSATVSTVGVPAGAHVLTATTWDAAGNRGTSAPVNVTVLADDVAPAVSMTATWCTRPGCSVDGTGVKPSAPYTVNIASSDAYGVTRIELWVDGALYVGQNGKPSTLTWTAPAAEGPHSLQVRAYDAAGNVGSTPLATVTVDGTPPSGSITSPSPGDVVSNDVLVRVEAADNLGVLGVSMGNLYDGTAPYELTWNSGEVVNGVSSIWATITDLAGNRTDLPGFWVTVQNTWTAGWDGALAGWSCRGRNPKCGSANVLDGRATFRSELQPSTLAGSCPDGTIAESPYSPQPYVESLLVSTLGGEPLDAGRPVRATVVAWGNQVAPWENQSQAVAVDLYYAPDATAPAWTWVGTIPFTYGVIKGTFTFDWTLASENPNGRHAVRATARQGGTAAACTTGDHDDHDDLAFDVGDHQGPDVAITSPAAGAVVVGPTTITADANDLSGVARVDFIVSGVLIGSDATPPYETTWNTLAGRNGSAWVEARAYDSLDLMTRSEMVAVTVADPTTELLTNGSFEGGHVGWEEIPFGGVIDDGAAYPAKTGSWKAVLGGTGIAGTRSLCQTVTVPAQASWAEVQFELRIVTSETTSYQDWIAIDITKPDGTWLANVWYGYNQDSSPDYSRFAYILTSRAGQDVRLCFEATEDAGLPTAFLVDDVTLWWK